MAHKLFRLGLPLGKQDQDIFNPKNEADRAALAAFYKNNEEGAGGWYPIGLSQTWHNGIHLTGQLNTPVRAIAPGRIVAARLRMKGGEPAKKPKEYPLGGPQFVLIQHDLKVLDKKSLEEKDPTKWTFRDVKFYSLYIHLYLPEASAKNIPWLKSFAPFLGPAPEADASGPSRTFARVAIARDEPTKKSPGLTFFGPPKKEGGSFVRGGPLSFFQEGITLEVLTPTATEASFAQMGHSKVKNPETGQVGWVRSQANQLVVVPEFATQVQELEKGGCSKLDYMVRAGECIGLVGEVKPGSGMVHLEVFSEENVIDKDDLSQWHLFENDADDDPLCEIQGLPKELEPLAYNSSALITPQEVQKTFTELSDTQRQFLRSCITRNKSVWAIEWKDVKKNNESWAKEFELTDEQASAATELMWWKDTQDAGVELPANPLVYHYHPLALMEYLALRLLAPPLFYVERDKEEFFVTKPSDLNPGESVHVYDLTVDRWQLGVQKDEGIERLWLPPGEHNLYELLFKRKAADYVPTLSEDARLIWASLWKSEGALAGINTWDVAFLSFGPFQQTMGDGDTKGELAGALDYVRSHSTGKDLFQKYFLDHGFDVDSVGGAAWMKTGYANLGGKVLKTSADKEILREFIWAYRFVKAMEDPAFSKLFLEQGFKRLQVIRDMEYDFGNGQKFKLSQIHKSQLAQALLLDAHINRPGFLKQADGWSELGAGLWAEPAKSVLGKLPEKALGSPGFELSSITAEHEFEMIKLIISFRELKLKKSSPVTDAAKRAAFIMLCVQGLDDDVAKACGYASVNDILAKTKDPNAGKYKYGFLGKPILKKPEKKAEEPPATGTDAAAKAE
ncbi:hypothetical protein [Archangium sp.]|uniref:hypothetical protein n=1 Tax=Archangium sp. TaxID=1872627 RepID=UPI002D584F8F|nr:hypothetical protein [Archangium sp.]HYO58595.1 hypothetical protein [Archangium sp.]